MGSILGLARVHVLMKNSPKARHQLKRIAKLEWNSEEAEDFEGWVGACL